MAIDPTGVPSASGRSGTTDVFDALGEADFLVADRDAAVAMAQRRLGFDEPKPAWSFGGPGDGFQITFCRANRSIGQAPTLVGLIELAELDESRHPGVVLPNIAGLAAYQGERPLKTHGTPVSSPRLGDLIESLRSRGVRHWVQPSSPAYPFSRIWMGIVADALGDYRPEADGGLMIEVADSAAMGLPEEAFDALPALPDDLPGKAMLRVASRGVVVEDLSWTLDRVAATFGWEPERGPERAADGSRRAVLGFGLPRSARVELLEAVGDREEADFLRRWGSGAWHIRIAVKDLGAKAEDLRSRGTPFREVHTGFEQPDVVLRVDRSATPGCLFEFMEDR